MVRPQRVAFACILIGVALRGFGQRSPLPQPLRRLVLLERGQHVHVRRVRQCLTFYSSFPSLFVRDLRGTASPLYITPSPVALGFSGNILTSECDSEKYFCQYFFEFVDYLRR